MVRTMPAIFDVSDVTDVFVQATEILKAITFDSVASPFTISIGGSVAVGRLTLKGVGMINNSGTTQNPLIAGLTTKQRLRTKSQQHAFFYWPEVRDEALDFLKEHLGAEGELAKRSATPTLTASATLSTTAR